jgi:hypothetical protein
MKRLISAVSFAVLAVPAAAAGLPYDQSLVDRALPNLAEERSAQADPQPSFVDFTPVTTEGAKASDADLRAAFPQPSFVDYTVLPTERAQSAVSDAELLSVFPQPSSIAN